jgi:hypothetical protein
VRQAARRHVNDWRGTHRFYCRHCRANVATTATVATATATAVVTVTANDTATAGVTDGVDVTVVVVIAHVSVREFAVVHVAADEQKRRVIGEVVYQTEQPAPRRGEARITLADRPALHHHLHCRNGVAF